MFLQNLLQLILSPGNGWEDIYRGRQEGGEHEFRSCYFPLVVIAAASALVPIFYYHEMYVARQILEGVVIFIMYFLGYYIGVFVLSTLNYNLSMGACRTFVLYSLSLLALITILVNCLPMTTVLLFFMPIYIAIIMWKGCQFLGVPKSQEGNFMLAAIFGVLLPPYFIYFLFLLLI